MSDPAETPPAPDRAEQPDTAAGAAAGTPEERVAALEAEVAQLRDRWLRAEAETQNFRARAERQIADARNYAIQKFARDVVEAAENLRRGLDALPPPAPDESDLLAKLRGGFEGVERSFLSVLERNGVVRRDVVGEPFDPEFHQAMAEQPATGDAKPGTVLQAWTPAWILNGRLLKPAMVVVAAGAAAKPQDTAA
ncbi:nucleotide exchange factor GrpE [Craurococcus roseus]|uniref:Protein GrpE n=1 Tax=Craurococcus roseus TaxID=77585 RepID=A0ABN1FGI5_9PROT